MRELWLDTETYSETPIRAGTYRYVEDAEIMLITWAIDDGEVYCVDLTAEEKMPPELASALRDPEFRIYISNVPFDRGVLRHNLGLDLQISRFYDVLIQARAHSLPGALGPLGDVLKLSDTDAKDAEGKKLIQLFCKPMPKNSKLRRATRHTHPEEWERFKSYARTDIRAMRAAHRKMPDWNYGKSAKELALWRLDQTINDRGFLVDQDLARAAVAAVEIEQTRLQADMHEATEGEVSSATKRDQLLAYLMEAHGVSLPNMQKATLERRLEDPDLPQPVKDLIAIRLEASGTSVSKYKALLRGVSADGRLRGTLQFRGAGRTGRWAGRTFQPQNLPRPKFKYPMIEMGIEALKVGCADLIFDNVMSFTASAIRSVLIAPPGKKLVVTDLSNIEGRDQAWLAGEAWKLQAFREYDEGIGEDLYKLAYAKSFGIDAKDVTDDQRQVGKVQELALGYAGGVGAFVTFAMAYRIDLDALVELAWPTLPPELVKDATGFYEWMVKKGNNTYGLAPRTYIMCEVFKRSWRAAHPAISSYWKELEGVIRKAILRPGVTLPSRRLKIRRDGAWLRIGLPSGRALCYPAPQVDENDEISYMGMNQYSRKWQRLRSTGGKFFENVCQAVACDVMTDNMPEMEKRNYEIVLTVHDETVTEAPDTDSYTADDLSAILATPPVWALDMPLAAKGFEGYRYRKD